MEQLISQYIDDELSLEEKIDFVNTLHSESTFHEQTLTLLDQERLLRQTLEGQAFKTRPAPLAVYGSESSRKMPVWLGFTGWAATALLLLLLFAPTVQRPSQVEVAQTTSRPASQEHRFVIYRPGIKSAEISGSFTDWRKITLHPAATSGYWEVTLKLTPGEHRFVYILDGSEFFPDPTVPTRETDDFGTSNSILRVEV